jgi:hypothetical protein
MRWLSYVWKVLENLFYILVVVVVLLNIREPQQKEIMAVLGLIYTTIRSIASGQALSVISMVHVLDKKIDHIQYQVDPAFKKPDYQVTDDALSLAKVKIYIDMSGLSIISLICLFAFFTAR